MKILKNIENLLTKIETAVMILLLSVMVLMAFLQVVLRDLFSVGILWGDVFLRHLVLWVGFLGAALATRDEKHFGMDILNRFLSKKITTVTTMIADLFAGVVCYFLVKASISFLQIGIDPTSKLIWNVPTWVFLVIIPIGFGLVLLHFVFRALRHLAATIQGTIEQENV